MTVGNVELAVGKVVNELFDYLFVGDYPQLVGYVVAIGKFLVGRSIVLRVVCSSSI